MKFRRFASLAAILVASAATRPLAGQVDVIRGRVTSAAPGTAPIENVSVTATSLTGNVSRTARTDKDGRYTIIFSEAEGDYFVAFVAIGYTPRQFEVKRTADQDILIADARLTPVGAVLDTVVTVGQTQRRRPARADTTRDVSGTERPLVPGLVPPDQIGDLAAMAATLPGVLFIQGVNGDPSGFSVLGLDAEQNNTTLNGMNSGASEIPRDAAVSLSLAISPYDVSQGQFSGGRLNIRTQPGSNYIGRTASTQLNTPQLEWTDRIGRSLGQQYRNTSLGGQLSGPIVYNTAFYNLSYQLGRRANDLHTLLNTDPLGLQTFGIAADSMARLLGILQGERIPATVSGFPSSRLNDQGIVLGSVDWSSPSSTSGRSLNLTFNGSWNRASPAPSLGSMLPASSFRSTNWDGAVQLHHANYYGVGILSETGIGVAGSNRFLTPYLESPSGSVLIGSQFQDGLSGVQPVAFGGTPASNSLRTNSVELTNQLSWFSANNKHRIKLTSDIRRDGSETEQANSQLGTFTFNSLSDLAAGNAASFSRQLTPLRTQSDELVAGVSLGDSYRRTPDLQIVYGVRLDANQYASRPASNPDVARLLGVANTNVPNGLYASPRIGFSWTYGTAPQIAAFDGAARVPRAVVRGGVGVFQNSLNAILVTAAVANTGLANAQQQITCVGAAVPVPDWAAYATSPSSIPTQCADGGTGTVFTSRAPNVTLFARDYAAQKSVRSTLQWAGAVLDNRAMLTVTGTYSRNLNQPGFVDANFNASSKFVLSNEGNRPVFVTPASIVASSGAVALGESRVTSSFNRVTELRSDFTSLSRQLSVQLGPASVNSQVTWALYYTLNSVRDHASGFASTAGDPFDPAAGRSSLDWRHQIIFNLGGNVFDVVRLSWLERFTSGLPFTPMVANDVNGDGYANDRAYIVDPARTADPALGANMTALLGGSPGRVRECLERQLSELAGRNSCEGPWTSTAFLTIGFNPVKLRMPQRTTLSFAIGNALGAADLLFHGENRLHGWGQAAIPDSRLLFVRGFDQGSQRFVYDVNPRFGNTSQAVNSARNPVTITASLRIDVGPTRERQGLTQTLDRGRKMSGTKVPEQMLKIAYGSAGIINPMAAILRDGDSLHLTRPQADSIATINRWYIIHLDSIWSPLAKYYADLPEAYDQDEAYRRYRRAREASVDLLVRVALGIRAMLTAEQRRRLPDLIAAYLDLRYLAAIRSGTSGTPGGVFAPGTGAPGAPNGRSG